MGTPVKERSMDGINPYTIRHPLGVVDSMPGTPRTDSGQMASVIFPVPESLVRQVVTLERIAEAKAFLQVSRGFEAQGPYALRRGALILLNSRSPQQAFDRLSGASSQSNGDLSTGFPRPRFTVTDELMPALEELTLYPLSSTSEITARVRERIATRQAWNDLYEARQTPKRSLQQLRERGVVITVDPDAAEELRAKYTTNAVCPILEHVKKDRILTINGFPESKGSLSIHDLIDHFWTYDLLQRAGVLDKYAQFLAVVGNPHTSDIFSREGELIASVTYDWRGAHTDERQGYEPFTVGRMQRILDQSRAGGTFTPNQADSYGMLTELDPLGDEADKLETIYSGILVETMEQRRKDGFIRTLDEDFNPTGFLSLIDPEYLALVITTNHILCDPATRTRDMVVNAAGIVEDHLVEVAQAPAGHTVNPLVIRLEDLANFDLAKSRLSPARQAWLKANPFHTASRSDDC